MSADPNQMTLPAVPEAPQQNGMVAMMERLALNPELPVDKLEKLLDMQLRIRAIESEQAFAEAMAKVQSELPTVTRDSPNEQTNSKYAKHEKIAKAIKPIYTKEGFSITFSEADSPKDRHIRIVGVLRHRAGHSERHHIDVALDDSGIAGKVNKTMTHAEASSGTYGRRLLTCMLFDVATGNDTDGNQPGDKITEDQAVRLRAMMDEFKVEESKFLEALQLKQLEDMPAASFNAARIALKARAKTKKPEGEK